ncbi:carboxymuconolactone decarboxylase family protein [Flavitalea sp. BT771]|uniref:carboxymuconolactone decarboxylase family protein n=1 Tax=Flavitalea sp. BT771 TaxID=3063329 RepID=UPI0026E2A7A1|nr:carboxymuconolactone decarboxylase family protein [Flavitalea sp. BT771]MDO6431110.1 carboxymuconolactone decarboxylase family protein [Flavitalea sp. BT771]MDV6220017.1 carboxymuconolactone decarboxylase family protein [Flavitalea sp. BT771]
MTERMNIDKAEPRIYKAMDAADRQIAAFDLDPKLVELVKLRASQINGCGYCVNTHSKDARKAGETEQRVFAIAAWWETPFFTLAEQAALKLTEEITRIGEGGLSEDTYQKALQHFGNTGVAQLIFTVVTINSWNRIAISMHMIAEKD